MQDVEEGGLPASAGGGCCGASMAHTWNFGFWRDGFARRFSGVRSFLFFPGAEKQPNGFSSFFSGVEVQGFSTRDAVYEFEFLDPVEMPAPNW